MRQRLIRKANNQSFRANALLRYRTAASMEGNFFCGCVFAHAINRRSCAGVTRVNFASLLTVSARKA
jgi:hypothetical protein